MCESGQTVYRGSAYVAAGGEPRYYVEEATVTGIEAEGKPLLRRFDQSLTVMDGGWRLDRIAALSDCLDRLEEIRIQQVGKFETTMTRAREEVAR